MQKQCVDCFFYKSEITAAENFNIKWNGTMFDLVANEELVIDSLAMVIADTGSQAVEIYTRNGSHLGHETDFFAWDYHGVFPAQIADSNAFTTLKNFPFDHSCQRYNCHLPAIVQSQCKAWLFK